LGNAQHSQKTQISLLTCDPGEALYSTFGHSAIRVFDPSSRFDEVYNYGTFNAFEDNFYIKFLRGKLRYKLSRYSYANFLREYHRQKRGVIEQVLQLDSTTQQNLIQFLETNNLPENQYYYYDFFFDNCSSIIRDIAEKEMPGFKYQDTLTENKSFRDLLDEHLGGMPWSDFGIDLIIGARADRKASFREYMFLPKYLSMHLEKAIWLKNNELQAFLSESYPVLTFEESLEKNKTISISPFLIFGFLLLLELVITFLIWKNGKPKWTAKYEIGVYMLTGISGLFMLLMWFGTEHVACGNNWNVLWANPLFIVMAISIIRKKELPGIKIFLILCLVLSLAGWSLIPQAYHIAFIPIILWLLLILCRDYLLKRKSIVV
jgi:hypothetical protein